jgi:two-component system response regulator YesN
MYRLLIVDDEEIIVNGLYEIFMSIQDLDMDIYKAYSAQEAIDWLSRTRIDIVLSDIMMPEMDGIELLEKIHSKWPFCKVIFLTGHEKFDYIYNALQIKDVGYILKSEDPDKVIYAVREAIKEIEKNNKVEIFLHEAKEHINLAKALFQKDYLNQVLLGNITNDGGDIFKELDIPLDIQKKVLLVMIIPSEISRKLSYMQYVEKLYTIKQKIEHSIWMKVASMIIMDDKHNFYMFVQPKQNRDETQQDLIAFLKGVFELVQSSLKETLHMSVNFLISEREFTWDNISDGYHYLQRLYSALDRQQIDLMMTDAELEKYISDQSMNRVLSIGRDEGEFAPYLTQDSRLTWMSNCFHTGNREQYFEKLNALLNVFKNIKSMNHSKAIEIYYECSLNILRFINERQINEKLAFRIGQNKLMRMDLFASWLEAAQYLLDISHEVFEVCFQESIHRDERIISKIQVFIENHLNEDLSLVRISEHIYLNPSYLSRFYKQKTGENLSEYIDKVRIRKVIEIMKSGNVRIHELGERVGYSNPGSFTRFFKKMTELTPQEYYEQIINLR